MKIYFFHNFKIQEIFNYVATVSIKYTYSWRQSTFDLRSNTSIRANCQIRLKLFTSKQPESARCKLYYPNSKNEFNNLIS